jgi:asparagine synthase (glutamine-hydrolysing)
LLPHGTVCKDTQRFLDGPEQRFGGGVLKHEARPFTCFRSMAHGLEMRAPFLDHRLAEFCLMMPAHLKIRRGITKYAMRQAARKWLPANIIKRSKQGFMFPVAYWLNDRVLNDIRTSLLQGPLVKQNWIEPAAVERLASEHRQRRTDHHVRIWMLLNLDAWFRIYVERELNEVNGAASGTASTTPRQGDYKLVGSI